MPGLFCPETCPHGSGKGGMTAEVYDPTGEVAAAGGIPAYVAAMVEAGGGKPLTMGYAKARVVVEERANVSSNLSFNNLFESTAVCHIE